MYTANDLQKRYNMNSKQAFLKYVREHMDEINVDGEHAAKSKTKEWEFDEVARTRLDTLRGISNISVVPETESEKVNQLNDQIKTLQTTVTMLQQEIIKEKEATNTALQEAQRLLKERQTLLLSSKELEKSKEIIAHQQETIDKLSVDMEVKKEATEQVRKDRDALEEERNQLKADYCMLQEENRRLKTRGFFSRLFNRF